jgi:hypothetical protein
VVRANQASAGTIWTRNSGTPLAALRGAQLAASFGASAVAPHDGTVTITGVLASGAIPGTGEPVGVAGGKTIVPFAATEPSPQEVTFSPQDAYQPGGFGLQDAILPRYLYSPAAIVPPKQAVFCIPPNEDLLACWSRVEDRLFKIRNCMDITGANRKPALFAPEIDPRLLVRMTAAGLSIDDVLNSTSGNLPPYRFVYLVDKAKQHAATVQSFGAQLLSAFEKGDAEELGHLRAVHDHNLLELRTKVTQLEIDAAEDAIEGLRRQKAAVEDRRQHFTSLREVGLSACERKQQDLHGQAANFRNAAGIAQVVASILTVIPDMGAWTAMKFGGSQLGASARAVAEGLNAVAGHYEVGSVRAGSEASQQRRDQDWQHQVEAARLELAQIDSHITAAEIKRDIAVRSLAIHEQTVAQSEELFEFLREKFSSVDRYRLLSKDLRRLHRQAFNSALALARMAEQAYRAERPGDDSLLAGDYWDAESAGLLAGERLVLDLERLERQFIETNYRELEIEHSFSLAQLAPDALSALQLIGECQFDIPEWFFDLTYPGQYRRRLKAVRITVPCVTGPYANIGATLRLDGSQIRLAAPLTGQPLGPLTAVPPRHTAAIATSRAQNDAGVFDFSFRDERYMPFEGAGAISSWTLQLPRTLRTFDYATINDIIVHLDYTAQYDEGLRQRWDGVAHELTNLLAAPAPAAPLLYRVFSLRGEFPDTFHRLVTSAPGTEVGLALDARHFPGFATGRDRHVEAGTAALRIVTPLRALPATSVSIARTVAAPPQPWRTVAAPAVPDRDGGELCEFDLGDVFATAASSPGVPADAIGPYVMRLATAVDPRDLQDIVLTIGYRLARTRP